MSTPKVDPFAEPSSVDVLADPDGAEVGALALCKWAPWLARELRARYFSCPRNAAVFTAIGAIVAREGRPDVLALRDELVSTGAFAQHWQDERDFCEWWSHRMCQPRFESPEEVIELARLRALREAGMRVAAAAENRRPLEAEEHAQRALKLSRWYRAQLQAVRQERVA